MKLQNARKDHKCNICGEKIPKGHNYWNKYIEGAGIALREHTNCELYKNPTTANQRKD